MDTTAESEEGLNKYLLNEWKLQVLRSLAVCALRQDIEILGAFISTIKEMELVQSLLVTHGSYVLWARHKLTMTPTGNAELGFREPLVIAFLPMDQYIIFFYVFLLKNTLFNEYPPAL